MALVVSADAALSASRRYMVRHEAGLQNAIQRLGTGLRVNSAKDDAAGLSISTRMEKQIRGDSLSIQNANNAVSVVQIAEGAMGEIANNLLRLRDLAVQGANGAMTANNGGQLQVEADQITQQISQIIQNTAFNGQLVLASDTGWRFQIGADLESTVDVSGINIAGESVTGVKESRIRAQERLLSQRVVDAVNGVDAQYKVNPAVTPLVNGPIALAGVPIAVQLARDMLSTMATQYNTSERPYQAAQATLTAIEGAAGGAKSYGDLLSTGQAYLDNTYPATVPPTSVEWTPLRAYNGELNAVQTINVSTRGNASAAIGQIDADIELLSKKRGQWGAVFNRLESIAKTLAVQTETTGSARSRIVSTDYGKETASLATNNILSQANRAIYAQANATPKMVLSLLKSWI